MNTTGLRDEGMKIRQIMIAMYTLLAIASVTNINVTLLSGQLQLQYKQLKPEIYS